MTWYNHQEYLNYLLICPGATPGSWPRVSLRTDAVLPALMGAENTNLLAERRTLGNEAGDWLLTLEADAVSLRGWRGRAGGKSDDHGPGNFLSTSDPAECRPSVTSRSYPRLPAPPFMCVGNIPGHEYRPSPTHHKTSQQSSQFPLPGCRLKKQCTLAGIICC